MRYNEILRNLRIDKDKTQSQIAEILGITRPQYYLYESGKRYFKIHHIVKLCEYYGVSSDSILGLPKNLKYIERKYSDME